MAMLPLTWCRWKAVKNTTYPITDLDQTYVDQAKVVWAAICEGYTTEPADPEARVALVFLYGIINITEAIGSHIDRLEDLYGHTD
jgi:hypothetical protein